MKIICIRVGKYKKDPNGTSEAEKFIWGGKNITRWFWHQLGTAENKISELEETAIKTIKNKAQTKKNKTE